MTHAEKLVANKNFDELARLASIDTNVNGYGLSKQNKQIYDPSIHGEQYNVDSAKLKGQFPNLLNNGGGAFGIKDMSIGGVVRDAILYIKRTRLFC